MNVSTGFQSNRLSIELLHATRIYVAVVKNDTCGIKSRMNDLADTLGAICLDCITRRLDLREKT